MKVKKQMPKFPKQARGKPPHVPETFTDQPTGDQYCWMQSKNGYDYFRCNDGSGKVVVDRPNGKRMFFPNDAAFQAFFKAH